VEVEGEPQLQNKKTPSKLKSDSSPKNIEEGVYKQGTPLPGLENQLIVFFR